MPVGPRQALTDVWIVVALVWVVGMLTAKRAVRRQSTGSRVLQTLFPAAAMVLLSRPHPAVALLAWQVLPDTPVVGWIGLVVALLGAVVAVWARIALGRNWSATVTITERHELVRRGPYRFVRHPIYSGLLLMVLGTAIAQGQLRGPIALGLVFTGFLLKSRTEDRFMLEQFGPEYVQYGREARAMIPGVF
jgi:protein-S-isoprenylcysteine O-methyltransferase Ste14